MPKAKTSRVPETDTEVAFKDSTSFTITFTIPNFSGLKNRKAAIFSPTIKVRSSTCHIQVTPKDARKGRSPVVGIYAKHGVRKCPTDTTEPAARIEMSIPTLKQDPNPKVRITNYNDVWCSRRLEHEDIFGEDAEKPLKDDKLQVRVEFKLLYQDAISDELPRYRLCKLFGSEVGRDFVLVTADGTERPVHKAILNAASPVFERMFQSKMEECRSGRCTIPDISATTLDILLNFMYNCSVDNLAKNAKDILLAADKYELLDLKKACEEALEDTLNLENAADVLLLADMASAKDLKKVVLDLVEKEAGKGDAAEAVDKMTDQAVKSGRTELVRELFSAVFKSGRKW